MSEEEIMQGINKTISFMKEELKADHSCFTIQELWAVNGLLDLYNKEKEKNKELEATLKQTQDSWYEDTKKIELNNECEIALNNRIIDLENELNKEKEKNKGYQELLKQNEFRRKIETCMTHNMPKNAEIICMIREDFERNFGNDYINKDKIREKIKEYKKYDNGINYENEISILQELLEEGDK